MQERHKQRTFMILQERCRMRQAESCWHTGRMASTGSLETCLECRAEAVASGRTNDVHS